MTELVDRCRYSFDCLRVSNTSVKSRSLDYSIQKMREKAFILERRLKE